ncbi:hypothetical protein PIB30_000374 [Stylosanthes scabra]|uniref:Uncharacterized protein n=1 Tax=Stylosanthes scabra TaxID=79078 RepID=A0ABU6U2K2_9FABA|nr:hypothetical protein [Stylosanthes scabra]
MMFCGAIIDWNSLAQPQKAVADYTAARPQLTSPFNQVSEVRISFCACNNRVASDKPLNGALIRVGLVFDPLGWEIPWQQNPKSPLKKYISILKDIFKLIEEFLSCGSPEKEPSYRLHCKFGNHEQPPIKLYIRSSDSIERFGLKRAARWI